MMGDEVVMADGFIDGLLSPDGLLSSLLPGGWHDGVAPQGTTGALGLYRFAGGRVRYASDDLPEGGTNPPVWIDLRYIITAVDVGSRSADLAPAVRQANALMASAQPREYTGGRVLWTKYGGPVVLSYLLGGVKVRELGARWTVTVKDRIVCGG